MKKPLPSRFSSSFALVSVLALVSLAALSATAFLASARLERLASRPLADLTRLEMASGTGLAMAMGVLAQAGNTNYGLQRIVTYWRTNEADDLGYLLVGVFTNPANSLEISYLPAFSAASMSNALDPASTQTNASRVTGQGNYRSSAFAGAWTNGLNPTNSTNFPLLGNQTSPLVAWIPIRQERRVRPGSAATTNVPVARMAFFVQDLQGLIDAERMGGEPNRTNGFNPAEISLTNLSGTRLTDLSVVSTFTNPNTRRLFASVGALTLSNAGGLATNDLRYVATGLRPWGWAQNNANSFSNRIPPGIQTTATSGYSTNAGQVKFDLNANVTSGVSSVASLVTILSNNLPGFTNRAGAMNGGTYLSNIAASIVDYADADSTPTTGGAGSTYFRGIEPIPWLNEVFTRIELVNRTINGNVYDWEMSLTDYVEVWNLSDKQASLANMTYFNSQNLTFWVGANVGQGLSRNLATVDTNCAPTNLTLPPPAGMSNLAANSYAVLAGTSRTIRFTTTTNTNILRTNDPRIVIPAANSLGFTYQVNGLMMSATPNPTSTGTSNRWTATTNLQISGGQRVAIFASAAAFGVSLDGNAYNLGAGDPRGQLFLGQPLMECSYNNSTPGGRNRYTPASGAANTVNPGANWPDGGHVTNNDLGVAPNGIAQAPNSFPNLSGNTNHFVQRLNNTGNYSNLFELGNIFDPIQWGGPNPFHPRDTAAWMELTGSHSPSNAACGRNSLRIGRPEHPRFAFTNFGGDPVPNMGQSAVALLDLFRIGSADGNSFTGGGKINLNTAPRPVLAALAGGVALTNDPARTPATAPANATMTNAFAQGILRFRQLYPFYSPSQLPFISTDYGVGTTWTNTWATTAVFATNTGAGLAGVTALNDAGREEWFSKIYGLSGVDSLNFRCYVMAQLTDANGNPRGAAHRKYYQIYTAPNPAALTNAALPPFRPVVVEEGSY